MRPEEIEQRSFAIITAELGDKAPVDETAPVVKRVIHATADFDYAENLRFTPGVIECALTALRQGADIVCDTNMARSGINRAALGRLNGVAYCYMADEDVAERAREKGVTRASVSMDKAAERLGSRPLIFAVGNAPTALIRLLELTQSGKLSPTLVIGAPVGFVNVVESKRLLENSGLPAIIAKGRKGGSAVAAAICNALLYLAVKRE